MSWRNSADTRTTVLAHGCARTQLPGCQTVKHVTRCARQVDHAEQARADLSIIQRWMITVGMLRPEGVWALSSSARPGPAAVGLVLGEGISHSRPRPCGWDRRDCRL